jgi:hypothetical protein
MGRVSEPSRTRLPASGTPTGLRRTELANAKRREVRIQDQERLGRGQWYWLSFANRTRFLGGAIVWARGIETAVLRARELEISSGFRGMVNVFCEPVPLRVMKNHVPPDLRNRLLSKEDITERLEGRSAF